MRIVILVAVLACFTGVAAQESKLNVADLDWMSGCWVTEKNQKGTYVSENWTKPLGTMLGTNRTINGGLVRAFEYLRIEKRTDGIYYVAKPSSAAGETSFALVSLEKRKAIFENKKHDFPKRIIYNFTVESKLTARVEDDERGFGFVMKKVGCD